jgi:hypothetical protein
MRFLSTLRGAAKAASIIIAVFSLTAVTAAYASPLPPGVSDQFTVYDSRGAIVPDWSLTVSEANEGTFFFPGVPFDAAQLGNATVLFEPGFNPVTQGYSDIFGIARIGGESNNLAFAFASDSDTALLTLGTSFSRTFVEGPNAVDATLYLSPELQGLGYTATFQSDFETPLPAALPLFATGLGAMGLLGWRRKRKNAAALAAA